MFTPELLLATLAMPSLSGLYIVCMIVGGGLLAISTIFGGDHSGSVDADVDLDLDLDVDMDVDVDMDMDVGLDGGLDGGFDGGVDGGLDVDTDAVGHDHDFGGADHHHGALALSTWFSISFLVYFAAAFGLTGTVLTHMTEIAPLTVLITSVLAGLGIGQGVHQTIRALKRSGGNSQISIKDFVGQPGRVTVSIKPPSRGEVGIRVGNREHFIPAVAQREDDSFQRGQAVAIVEYSGGLAVVVSRKEHDFINNS
ncbi:MAG: hypothetical protein DHS20C16_27150 [Phycisphaerae bacterium]|nr:MAG: hypothetical protein DHS20C16_27150 [Phycisphaerae bacterium]